MRPSTQGLDGVKALEKSKTWFSPVMQVEDDVFYSHLFLVCKLGGGISW